MKEPELRKICLMFAEKLGPTFSTRIERSIGQNFEEGVEEQPRAVLIRILQDVYMLYVCPYEMVVDISEYLKENFDIPRFSLSFSEKYDFPMSEKMQEAKNFVDKFYAMVKSLDLDEVIIKQKEKWWRNE